MRAWLHSIDGSPGITQESINALKRKAEESETPLLVSLIKDEIYIKKKIEYHAEEKEFSGFVTFRCNDESKKRKKPQLPCASKALVYMVVGSDFKIPVAYYLMSEGNAQTIAALTLLLIKSINGTGVKVISLTQDGPQENFALARELGANFQHGKPYFVSPTDENDKIYIFFDPAHMIKLARGCLGNQQLFCDNIPLGWKFIAYLHEMQKKRNLNLGNKLSDMHINFKSKPMNVRLASETLSNSVADCIDLLRSDGYEDFENSEKTTEYIRWMNNCFDVLNFKSNINGAGDDFKRPLNLTTAPEFFEYFKRAREYFHCIEIDEVSHRWVKDKRTKEKTKVKKIVRKLAIESTSFTPFAGFAYNLTALEGLYTDYVLNGPLEEIITFQLSQDHLETWFSSVRSGLGNSTFLH